MHNRMPKEMAMTHQSTPVMRDFAAPTSINAARLFIRFPHAMLRTNVILRPLEELGRILPKNESRAFIPQLGMTVVLSKLQNFPCRSDQISHGRNQAISMREFSGLVRWNRVAANRT